MSGAIPGEGTPYGHFGVRAVLAVLDTESREVRRIYEYEPADELNGGQNIQFTGYAFHEGRIYVCSFNEVLVLEGWPQPRLVDRITDSGFNDLHHCIPWQDGLAIANTGLETVDHIGFDGVLKERWDLLRDMEGARKIDGALDYRMIPNTKPHHVHVNHLFVMRDELWSTQLQLSAALPVTGGDDRIAISVGLPHDGSQLGKERVFTTTNGHIALFDADSGVQRRIVNLLELTTDLEQLGWCRGVTRDPSDPDLFYVAFTKARKSTWREVAYRIRHGHFNPPSRIALYDLGRARRVDEWLVGEDPGLILFQIQVLPEERRI